MHSPPKMASILHTSSLFDLRDLDTGTFVWVEFRAVAVAFTGMTSSREHTSHPVGDATLSFLPLIWSLTSST